MIWDERLTSSFRPAPLDNVDAPFALDEVFHVDTQTLGEVCKTLHGRDDALQARLAQPLSIRNVTGQYSLFHFAASYVHGPASSQAVNLAHKSTLALDAPKLGLRIREEVLRADQSTWDRFQLPECYWTATGKPKHEGDDGKRQLPARPQHILEILSGSAKKVKSDALGRIHVEMSAGSDAQDDDLLLRYREAQARYAGDQDALRDLEQLEQLCQLKLKKMLDNPHRQVSGPDSPRRTPSKKRKREESEEELGTHSRDDFAVDFNRPLDQSQFKSPSFRQMAPEELCALRASTLYYVSQARKFFDWPKTRLAFELAFTSLCQLKAERSPVGHRVIRKDQYEAMTIDKRWLKS